MSNEPVSSREVSAMMSTQRDASRGVQVYEEVAGGQLEVDAVGRPVAHLSAIKHTTGEARFLDDMPYQRGL